MNDQAQWNKLYQYLDQRFDAVDGHLAEMGEHFDMIEERLEGIETTVDTIYKRLENTQTQQTAIKAKLDRHDRWHHQAADKLGLQLDS